MKLKTENFKTTTDFNMTKKYEPKFYTTERDGKIALWVVMPNGVKQNIWDVEKKVWTEDMKKAIISSFLIGGRAILSILTTNCSLSQTVNGIEFTHMEGECTL